MGTNLLPENILAFYSKLGLVALDYEFGEQAIPCSHQRIIFEGPTPFYPLHLPILLQANPDVRAVRQILCPFTPSTCC